MTRVAGRYEPDRGRKALYEHKFARFEKALDALSLFHAI